MDNFNAKLILSLLGRQLGECRRNNKMTLGALLQAALLLSPRLSRQKDGCRGHGTISNPIPVQEKEHQDSPCPPATKHFAIYSCEPTPQYLTFYGCEPLPCLNPNKRPTRPPPGHDFPDSPLQSHRSSPKSPLINLALACPAWCRVYLACKTLHSLVVTQQEERKAKLGHQ